MTTDRRSKRISMAVSPRELEILRAVATSRGVTVSDLLRRATFDEILTAYYRERESEAGT